jgi:hypothetical protein
LDAEKICQSLYSTRYSCLSGQFSDHLQLRDNCWLSQIQKKHSEEGFWNAFQNWHGVSQHQTETLEIFFSKKRKQKIVKTSSAHTESTELIFKV